MSHTQTRDISKINTSFYDIGDIGPGSYEIVPLPEGVEKVDVISVMTNFICTVSCLTRNDMVMVQNNANHALENVELTVVWV